MLCCVLLLHHHNNKHHHRNQPTTTHASHLSADHVMRALQQLGFDDWAAEVRTSHEEFKEEAKSEWRVHAQKSDQEVCCHSCKE